MNTVIAIPQFTEIGVTKLNADDVMLIPMDIQATCFSKSTIMSLMLKLNQSSEQSLRKRGAAQDHLFEKSLNVHTNA